MPQALDRLAVIESMCLTWRHDFGMDRINGDLAIGNGMSDGERDFLRREMGQLFDHHVAPAVEAAIREEREACLSVVRSHGETHAKIRYIIADIAARPSGLPCSQATDAGTG